VSPFAGPSLASLARCFEGALPAAITTCSSAGVPNVTWLSIVHRVDDTHIALSFQFFNKTRRNLLENPRAQVMVTAPDTAQQYRLDVTYERAEHEGPLFNRMAAQLAGIASQAGMTDVFALRGVDIYVVHDVEPVPGNLAQSAPLPEIDLGRIEAFSAAVAEAADLDGLVTTTLDRLAALFGYHHCFLLAADDGETCLYTLGSRGYDASGIGSDLRVGEGLIGVAAQTRVSTRVGNVARQMTYARAVKANTSEALHDGAPEIPLPGLPGVMSQLAVPLVTAGRLVGVLCLQSETPGRFLAADEQALTILGRQVAAAMLALSTDPTGLDVPRINASAAPEGTAAQVRHYAADDSVFIDGEYLIKGLAGRILWLLLGEQKETGRTNFSNKGLRVDPRLGLPSFRDNLEARLLLLRRRLEENCPFIRLTSTGRGTFRLAVTRAVTLEDIDAP